MRNEAALGIGALGSVVAAVVLVATGNATPETAGEATNAAVLALTPVVTGAVTRFAVWSQRSVERLLGAQREAAEEAATGEVANLDHLVD